MTSSASTTLATLLSRFPAFSQLDDQTLAWLAARSRPFHGSVGQEILKPDRAPEFCYAIVEGRGRVLHNDPGLQRPVTLAYCKPGDLIGWAGLACRRPSEWVTAIEPLKLIGLQFT